MKNIKIVMLFLITYTATITAQSFNLETTTQKEDTILIGKINKKRLSSSPYSNWFTKNYSEYKPKKESIEFLKTELNQYTITIFMGTWCGDSKREIPRVYKILNDSEFSINRITTIAVSRDETTYKQSLGGEQEGLNIHRVPTIIFYKNGKEINRIIETPNMSLEEDMINILKGIYKPNYQSVFLANKILKEKGGKYFSKKIKRIAKQLTDKTKNIYELNTYANVLYSIEKKEEAIIILQLNILLFPSEAKTYINLGNKFMQMESPKRAITEYKKSLELSDDKEIKKRIMELQHSINNG